MTTASPGPFAPLPPLACDCHTHVIGPSSIYPMAQDRQYTPGPASADALQTHLTALGLQRVVIVQPSVYGEDHRCLLEALACFDGRARGVAAPSTELTAGQRRAWHASGIRGVRINLESGWLRDPVLARQALRRSAACVADTGWHVQVYAAHAVIDAVADTLVTLGCPVVLDHFALAEFTPAALASMRDLLRSGNVHLKLSAPYRLADQDDALRWAQALTRDVPDALLWGSDWPHTARAPHAAAHEVSPYRRISGDALARDMLQWLPSPALRQTVLIENPSALYWAD